MRMHCGKRVTALLLTLVLCFPLVGCGGEESPAQSGPVPEIGTENSQSQASGAADETPTQNERAAADETPTQDERAAADETPAQDERAAAREAYLDFLSGRGTVTTSEAFRQKDEGYNLCPAYGTYSYEELKYAAADEMMGNGSPRYTFLDVGGDGGAELLVLRFENEDPSFLNWTGIIRYDGGALTMTYSYEDGYRIEGELFTSGFLRIGGSGGAGAYEENGFLVEEDGTARALYASSQYWGSFAPDIQYQLEESRGEPMWGQYYDLSPEFYVETYSDENGLWAFAEYSGNMAPEDRDPEALALEDAFVNELTEQGIRMVDWETFIRLFDKVSEYSTQPVTWTDFEDGLPSALG